MALSFESTEYKPYINGLLIYSLSFYYLEQHIPLEMYILLLSIIKEIKKRWNFSLKKY